MNDSRISTYLIGIILIVVGVGVLLGNLNFFHFNFGNVIVPLILVVIGIKLFDRGKQTAAVIMLGIGALMLLSAFGINIGNFIGVAFSLAVIYLGYRMMRSKKREFKIPSPPARETPPSHFSAAEPGETPFSEKGERGNEAQDRLGKEERYREGRRSADGGASFSSSEYSGPYEEAAFGTHSRNTPKTKHSLIGNLYLTAPRWELTDMNIWHGIGEVKIDLSRALIHETETVLIINGWIGDIDIHVPYDLEIAISANVNIGDIDVLGNGEGGINKNVSIETSAYRDSPKRVRIVSNLLIGDIDVTYV